MVVEKKICFYLNHTRDITMYSDFFLKLNHKKVCFVFNDLFKEKKNNNFKEYQRIKTFLKQNFSKYKNVYKLSEKIGSSKFKILISAGDIPTSFLSLKSIFKYILKKLLFINNAEIYDRKYVEKEISLTSIRFPNNLDRNIKHFPQKNWEKVFDIFLICFKQERKLILEKFKKKKIFNIGFPRLDKKFNKRKIKEEIIKEFKLIKSKKIIFYLPTLSSQKLFIVKNYVKQLQTLSKYFNVVVRPHPKDQDLHKEKFKIFKKSKLKLDLKDGRDTANLILASDLIISDGGSSVVEAIYLKKKVIFHNWFKSVSSNELEKRFTEKERLDRILGEKVEKSNNLSDIKKINFIINKNTNLTDISKLRKSYFFSEKRKNLKNLINSIYDN